MRDDKLCDGVVAWFAVDAADAAVVVIAVAVLRCTNVVCLPHSQCSVSRHCSETWKGMSSVAWLLGSVWQYGWWDVPRPHMHACGGEVEQSR